MARTAFLTLDSTKINPLALRDIEEIMYGTASTAPRMPLPAEIIAIVKSYGDPDPDDPDPTPGAKSPILPSTSDPGTFSDPDNVLKPDTSDVGTFLISHSGLSEDPQDPGTYTIGTPS